MTKKPEPKKKIKPGLSQKERFIEYAKAAEADETGETFNRAFKAVVAAKK